MNIDYELLKKISNQYGESFYLLDSKQFAINFRELLSAFRKYYSNTNIAYSYKTNYTPKLCRIVNDLGGYAEVVSDMEIEIARRVGVPAERIVFNGPYKNFTAVTELLADGGCVNIDSLQELYEIKTWLDSNTGLIINVGVRCNFEISDGVISRFGVDITSPDFDEIMNIVNNATNINLRELHCHFAVRKLETWSERAEGMITLLDGLQSKKPDNVDLGGGLYGKMGDSLKQQFSDPIPCYDEYAEKSAKIISEYFSDKEYRPLLLIEPGSALVGDCMKFAAKVVGIKTVRGKNIATLLGSIYNINPTLNKKNPPINVYRSDGQTAKEYTDLDFGGFTCIESDYLYRHYNGMLAIGDYVVFDNVGSYSIVLKPPFILPNFSIIDCSNDNIELIKRRETFDDLFHTFSF